MGRIDSWVGRSSFSSSDYASVASEEEELNPLKQRSCWKRMILWLGVSLICLIVLAILAIWVIFPLVFMQTQSLQKLVVFWNFDNPTNPEYDNPEKYGIKGAVNFYLNLTDLDGKSPVRIGAWLVVPEKDVNFTQIPSHSIEMAASLLAQTDMPVVISMHGVHCTRVMMIYEPPRKYFMVIAPDHRGYGDSNGEPSEDGIVSDSVQIYKWVRNHTNNDIYVWGHSQGSALTTHLVRKLKEDNIIPKGVVLESAYTTLREEISACRIGKVFSWLPYFESTVLDPLWNNGFQFLSTEHILYVDSPIMIMHSEDDVMVPVKLGRKLAEVARTQRNLSLQGNVTYHEFAAHLRYGHVGLTSDGNMPAYLEKFIDTCNRENKGRG